MNFRCGFHDKYSLLDEPAVPPYKMISFFKELATSYRIGLGEDRHRLAEGGPIWLGGVEIPHTKHLVAHSDGDVLLHAVTDALLGAAGCADIGELFPNTDPANKDRDSAELLQLAWKKVAALGWKIVNLDCVIHAQSPKVSTYKAAICERIASILGISASQVGLKGKTGEEVGPIGRGEAIDARCVALLQHVP